MPRTLRSPRGRRAAPAPLALRDLPESFERDWEHLADVREAPPALYPDYLRIWERAYAGRGRIALATAEAGGRLTGVLPLLPSRILGGTRFLASAEETGILAADEPAEAAVARAAVALPFACLRIAPVPRDGGTLPAMREAARQRRSLDVRLFDRQPVVDVTTGWPEYWAGLSRNTRKDVKRRRQRLAELGETSIEVVSSPDEYGSALDAALEIEASGWKGRAGTAIAARPQDTRFYRELAEWAAGRGWLRISLLRLDGRAIAFHYSLQAGGVLRALKIGYAEDLASYSPGTVLLASEIERCFAEGCRQFDFAGSAQRYKTRWATGERQMVALRLYRRTPTGQAVRLASLAKRRAKPAAKRVRRFARERGVGAPTKGP